MHFSVRLSRRGDLCHVRSWLVGWVKWGGKVDESANGHFYSSFALGVRRKMANAAPASAGPIDIFSLTRVGKDDLGLLEQPKARRQPGLPGYPLPTPPPRPTLSSQGITALLPFARSPHTSQPWPRSTCAASHMVAQTRARTATDMIPSRLPTA